MSASLSPATVHSAPNTVGTGLALKIGSREASPIHPGVVSLPGSMSVLETPVAASLVAASSLAGAPGGRVVERVGSDAPASFIQCLTLRHEPGSQPPREGSDVRPVIGFFHGHNLGESHAREVVNPCRRLGNVCRA